MDNIDDFNRGAALILAELYRHFPIPVPLDILSLDEHDDLPANDLERREQRLQVYVATVRFLGAEGWLVFDDELNGSFTQARLTAKGLSALNRVPDAMRPARKNTGERLLEAASELGKLTAKDTLSALMQQLFS